VSGSDICKSAPRLSQITMPGPHYSVFAGRMPFLPPNQQRQSTEGKHSTICNEQQFLWWWPTTKILFLNYQYFITLYVATVICNLWYHTAGN